MVGSLGYAAVVFLLRTLGKRSLAQWNSFDFVVTVALGAILASMLLSQETSLAQGMLGVTLLLFYQFILAWLAARSPWVQTLIRAKPSLLVYQGEFRQSALKRERVAESEILAAVRSTGIGDLIEVDAVVLETDGSFSVIKKLQVGSALRDVEGFSYG
ncbi:MAG: YetF domain-containing protein [Cyanobacteria bacterium J06638_28]